jgi:predicted RNA-binding protein
MTFKKYSIKSHYKVNKLVRIIKISHFKNLSDNLNMKKYFSKLDVILNSKRQNLGLIKHSLLKSDALIKLGFFRLKTCPKK